VPGLLARPADHARLGPGAQQAGVADRDDVGEFLVFPAERGVLRLAMDAAAIEPDGEVTPVGAGHRTVVAMRARGGDRRPCRTQPIADGADPRETGGRARLDDDERA